MSEVVVVTGIGGMGIACACRLGAGRELVVADFDEKKLERERAGLARDGFSVTAQPVDVSDPGSVGELARVAAGLGALRTLVHTAGLSPTQASAERVLEVDMLGTDHVLNVFLDQVTDGTVAVCIASMGGYVAGLSPEREHALAVAPTDELLATLGPVDLDDFGVDLRHRQAGQPAPGGAGGDPVGPAGRTGGERQPRHHLDPHGPPGARGGRERADAGDALDLAAPPHGHRRGHRVGGRVAGRPGGVVRHRLRPPGRRRRDRRHPRLRAESSTPPRASTDPGGHSHSIVAGGLLEMSSTTRLTSSTSLVMRVEIRSSTSVGRRAQSAVMASSLVIGRSTMGCA